MTTPGADYANPIDQVLDALAPGPARGHGRPGVDRPVLADDALVGHRGPLRGLRTTAKAKGLKDARVLRQHVLPNALLPAVTLIAINLGYIVAGAITVEQVFSWPGLGTLTVDALRTRDYPMMQGLFLVLSISVVAANFAADLVLRRPRTAAAMTRPDTTSTSRPGPGAGGCASALARPCASSARDRAGVLAYLTSSSFT